MAIAAPAIALTATAGPAVASVRSAGRAQTAAAVLQRVLSTPKLTSSLLVNGGRLIEFNPQTGKLVAGETSPAHCHYAASTKPTATPGQIGDAHPSTYLRNSRRVEAIKVNSYIVCDHAVQSLSNQTSLYKTGHFLIFPVSHLQRSTTTDNAGKAVLPNLETYRICTNRKSTTWYGNAVGISEEAGKFYVGVGASPHKRSYACGT